MGVCWAHCPAWRVGSLRPIRRRAPLPKTWSAKKAAVSPKGSSFVCSPRHRSAVSGGSHAGRMPLSPQLPLVIGADAGVLEVPLFLPKRRAGWSECSPASTTALVWRPAAPPVVAGLCIQARVAVAGKGSGGGVEPTWPHPVGESGLGRGSEGRRWWGVGAGHPRGRPGNGDRRPRF